jgi:hypothetical protein
MMRWAVIALAVVVAGLALWGSWIGIRHKQQAAEDGFKHFTFEEFDSPDAPGSGREHMDPQFIRKLDNIRSRVGLPFFITSGYRTEAHNRSVGGAANSSHMRGLAADIAAPTDAMKRSIARASIAEGITRIGWGRTFIHLDDDRAKQQQTVWGYANSTPPTYASLAA